MGSRQRGTLQSQSAPIGSSCGACGKADVALLMVLSTSSMTLHRQSQDEPRRTRWSFWRAQARAPVEAIRGAPDDYKDRFVSCECCRGKDSGAVPQRSHPESSGEEEGASFVQNTRDSSGLSSPTTSNRSVAR